MASRLDIGLTSQNASALGRVVEIIIKPPEKTIVMHIKSNYFHRKGLLMYKIKTLIIVLSKLNLCFFHPKQILMVQYWEESGQSQAGGSARARVKAGCADPLAGRWLARRSSRRLWSSEGLAEGVLGNHGRRTEAGSWLCGAGDVREGRGEGGVREGQRIRAGHPASRAVPTAGLVLIKQNATQGLVMHWKWTSQNHWTERWRLINFHIDNLIKKHNKSSFGAF